MYYPNYSLPHQTTHSWTPRVGQAFYAPPTPLAPEPGQAWPLFLMAGLVTLGGLLLLRDIKVI